MWETYWCMGFQSRNGTLKPLQSFWYTLYLCFVWISEQTAIISLYSINWLVCITESECVYSAVRTGYLYITHGVMHTTSLCYRPSDNRVRSWCRHYSTGDRSRTPALSHRQREWGCNAAPDSRDDFSRRPESNICNPPYPRSVSLRHPAWVRQWCGTVHHGTWHESILYVERHYFIWPTSFVISFVLM